MKVIFNYATRQFESMEPTLRDRFQLGGRVNYAKGTPFQITDDVLEQVDNLIKNTNLNLKEIGKRIGFGTDKKPMDSKSKVFQEYIKKYGKPSDARLQTRGVPLSPEKGIGKKIVTAFDKQIKNFGKPNLSQIVREVYGPGVKDFDSARAQVRSVLEDFRDYKGKANIPIDKKDLTAEQIKTKARVKKLKLVDNPTIAKFMAGPKGSGFQYHHMDATKTSPVTLNNVVYLPDEVNNYIQSYEGPITQRKKEIIKLNKNKPKGYKKQIDAKLNQIRNTIAKADMDLDKAGYSAYKGVIEVDTIDVNGKPLKIGGGSALRLGEGLAEELGLDSNKPLKEFSSEEKIKLTEAKKALIKKSSINKPKATGLAKKGLKTVLKQVPLVGSAIGLYDVGKAVKAGIRDPRDLYTAYEVSPEIAEKQKAIREDPTGKLLKEEIANLPEITTDDQVAGALMDSFPNQSFLQYQSAVDDGFQGSFEEYLQQQSMKMARGGRVGFANGSPNPLESEATIDQALAALNSSEVRKQFLYDTSPIGKLDKNIFGKDGDRNLIQQFNTQFLDPRSYPYYAQKTLRGAANIPELAVRFPLAASYLFGKGSLALQTGDLSKFSMEDLRTAMEILEPKFTNLALDGTLGDVLGLSPEAIQAVEEKRAPSQKATGDLLQFTGEAVGPATPLFLTKFFPKLPKQIKDLVGTTSAVDKVNKEIERRASQEGVDQTRRDILLATGAGGAVALLKLLGLDNLFKAAPKAVKAAPEIVTKGGTPKYFFDFVNLIKSKGDDISETASTIERQKVYDYNGYTLTEELNTGKINIRKETEGGGSYPIGDGEYETIEGIMKIEEINYNPPETIINDKGKSVRVPDNYSEDIATPDRDGGLGDVEPGLDSIDEVLELLAKDGKKYSLDELIEMGVSPEGIGDDFLLRILKDPSELKITKIRSKFDKKLDAIRKERLNKAGGGIMKMAGDDSGPPPKSGPTPHGLPYIAKNVRPIKERK